MERLTRRYVDGQAWVSMDHVAAAGEYECVGPAIDRLAAYEDTGLTPEDLEAGKFLFKYFSENRGCLTGAKVRLCEILEAEKDGRLAVMPCKPGDTMWTLDRSRGVLEPWGLQVIGTQHIINTNWISGILLENLGRSLFRTREEAEAAILKMKEEP